jgi:antitoxin ParD1/3/4
MAREATLSVSLTSELKDYVRQKVDSGQFESASEVIRQGLRTMQEREQYERLFWSDVRKKVKEARTAIAEGDILDGPTFMHGKIASLKAKARAAAPKRKHKSL